MYFCLARIPPKGEFRGNLAAGGSGIVQPLTEKDLWIAEKIAKTAVEKGLLFIGIDIIGEFLTEINVTCPTGVRQIKNLGGPDIPEMFWRYAEGLY
jgi:glutathione synthase